MSPLHDDPNWPRASDWLAGGFLPGAARRLAVLGVPAKTGSITPGRCDLAPDAIRSALRRFSTYDVEHDCDLRGLAVEDLGDLDVAEASPEQAFGPVASTVSQVAAGVDAVVLLGGDNSITRPGCHGVAPSLARCGLLTFDAHFDLRDLDRGLTNGNPVRALLADGLPGDHVVQIGIQPFANSKAYADVARQAGIRVILAGQVHHAGIDETVSDALCYLAQRAEVIYVDLDIDVLDRAFAPATAGSRPGGLAPWELRRAARACGLDPKVKALDLVEIDPTCDVAETTVLAAGACLLSFASGLARRPA